MKYHLNLATIARRTGFPVTEITGWQTRGKDSDSNPCGMADRPQSVICHHTAGPLSGDYPSLRTVTYGRRPKLINALSNYGLGRSGRIYVIAAGECWHAGTVSSAAFFNANAIGIEAENTGVGERWPAVQVEAYARLCAELRREFGIPASMVRGHKEVRVPLGYKIDPAGIDMDGFRDLVAARLAHPDTSTQEDIVLDKETQDWFNTKFGTADSNETKRVTMILAAVATEGTSPAELQAGLTTALSTQAEDIATQVVERLGGSADAATIKAKLIEVLTEGTGGTP